MDLLNINDSYYTKNLEYNFSNGKKKYDDKHKEIKFTENIYKNLVHTYN